MNYFNNSDYISKKYIAEKIQDMNDQYIKLLKELFDAVEHTATANEEIRDSKKYIKSSQFKLNLRGLRADILKTLEKELK